MMPSMPRLSTPARSQTSSPMVAKISGEAILMAATQKEAVNRISTASIPRDAPPIVRGGHFRPTGGFRKPVSLSSPSHPKAGEQDGRDHGQKRGRHHHVGDVARHAGRPAHRVGAHED